MTTPVTVQVTHRWVADDEDLTTATLMGSGNGEDISLETGTDNRIRVRIRVEETAGGNFILTPNLYFSYDGGAYEPMSTTSDHVRAIASKNTTWTITDDDAITANRLGAGNGVWEDGHYDANGVAETNIGLNSEHTECEYCIYLDDATVVDGKLILLRVYDATAALGSYTDTPQITVTVGAVTHTANAQLDGAGTITALAEVVHQATSTLAGIGTITALPASITGFIQEYFRIRKTDSDLLNDPFVAGDPAENVNATIGTGDLFRIRFKVRRAEAGAAVPFKPQVSFNSGAWTDVGILLGAAVPCVLCKPSGQFTDGDATSTELLTNVGTYTNGEGVASVIETGNILTNSYDLDILETEFEFCFQILSFFGAPSRDQVQGSDTIEFRLVESDGTAFSSYTNPTITVSETDGYVGAVMTESPNKVLHVDSNDNVYYLAEDIDVSPLINIFKSTDRGATWREMDGAGRPSNSDLESGDIFVNAQSGYIGIQHGSDAYHHQFDFSDHGTPDNWAVIDEAVKTSVTRDDQSAAIVRRSDGSLVQFWQETVSGVEQIKYKIKNGTWGGEVAVDTEASTTFTWVTAVLGESDLIHIFYKDNTNGYVYTKSLTSGDVLNSRQLVYNDSGTGGSDEKNIAGAVYYDASGAERIVVCIKDESDGLLYTVLIEDDGSPDTADAATDNQVEAGAGAGALGVVADIVVDGTDVFILYADATNGEIWVTKNSNDGGWDTDTKIVADVVADYVRGVVFSPSGGSTQLGFIYENQSNGGAGQGWYDEYEIAAGGVVNSGANLAGVGTLIGLAEVVHQATISLPGVGAIIAAGTNLKQAQAVLDGVGTQVALAEVIHQAISMLAGIAGLTALAEVIHQGIISLDGVGTVSALAETIHQAQSTLLGVGTVTAYPSTGGVTHTALMQLDGAGTITPLAEVIHQSQSVLDGVGSITLLAEVVHQAISQLDGVGNIIGLGEVVHQALSQLDGVGNLVALGETIHQALSQLDGIGTLTAVGSVTAAGFVNGTSQLDGTGAIAPAGAMVYISASQLDGAGVLSATGSWIRSSDSVLNGIGSLDAIGNLFKSGVIAFSGEGLVISGGVVTYGGALVAGGVATITPAGFLVGGTPTAFTVLVKRSDDIALMHEGSSDNLMKVK